jgi:hypothetical protein
MVKEQTIDLYKSVQNSKGLGLNMDPDVYSLICAMVES